jgi:pSer/pThr/pTyr-binding forkhead associated (FHA) protein
MAKLVVLNEGLTGQSYELKVEKTTVGRVEDNAFHIPQGSISSHHCEIWLRGNDVVVKDLNSTNGTFVNGQQVTSEAVLKPGQTLRLGQVELRLDTGAPGEAVSPAPAAAPSAPKPPSKKPLEATMVISKGVSLEQLEQGPQGGFDTTKGVFTKKKNSANRYLIWVGVLFVVILLGVLWYIFSQLKGSGSGGGN